MEGFREIGFVILALIFVENASAQTFSFPEETMLSRVERLSDIAKENGQSITYDARFLQGVMARSLKIDFSDRGTPDIESSDTEMPDMGIYESDFETLLRLSLENTPLTYREIHEKRFVIVRRHERVYSGVSVTSHPFVGHLTGRVTDMFGEPLPGATVRVRNEQDERKVQRGTATGVGGDYLLQLPPGQFDIKATFLGYGPILVKSVKIEARKSTRLDVVLKETEVPLHEIVVSQVPSESTIIGALLAQRNTPGVSAVLARQEIERSAASTIREAMHLVPGIAVSGDNGIVVRGLKGRWNEIAIDGVPMPDYDPSYAIFSFDLLPISSVESIRLLKSSTPDIETGFGSSMINIVTKDIPEENFVQFKAGFQMNPRSTFQNRRTRRSGRYDFIALDDGSREVPSDNEQLPSEHFRIYNRETMPSQQYSVTVARARLLVERGRAGDWAGRARGREIEGKADQEALLLDQGDLLDRGDLRDWVDWGDRVERVNRGDRVGVLFSLSYENRQQQSIIEHTQRGRWKNGIGYTGNMGDSRNRGHTYGYNTVTGGLLNAGLRFGKSEIGVRNIFTRGFENDVTEVSQRLEDFADNDKNLSRQFFNYPTFSTLLQNKVHGQHGVNSLKIKWNLSHTLVERERKDAAFSEMYKPLRDDSLLYFLHDNPRLRELYPASSGRYGSREQSFRVGAAVSFPFSFPFPSPFQGEKLTTIFTVGYNGNYRRIRYGFSELLLQFRNLPAPEIYTTFEREGFKKTVTEHLPFAMLEQRWREKIRLVWGVRGNYESIVAKWEFMPSVNLTFAPLETLNTRVAYSRSVIYPRLTDYIPFPVYNTRLLGTSVNRPIRSSCVGTFDFQVERQLGTFDFISAGLFYRYISHPIERTTHEYARDERMYVLQNSDKATNLGAEASMRKHLGFIADVDFFRDIQLVAGFTCTRSSVYGKRMVMNNKGSFVETESVQKRPLSGQTPYLLTVGFNYMGGNMDANILFNRSSRQLFVLGENAFQHEYRAPFNSLEAAVSYRFPKSGIKLKLSGVNLLNSAQVFYTNSPDDYVRDECNFPTDKLLPRKSENYDKGRDPVIHKIRDGCVFSLSVSRTF